MGIIYGVIGISGVGKSYLVNCAVKKYCPNLKKLVAVTTRPKRPNEIDGEDKYFLSKEQFMQERENMVFIRSIYGAYYGFKTQDLKSNNKLIVELYYKDFLKMKKEKYDMKGIYIWTPRRRYRKGIVKKRYCEYIPFLRREIADIIINIIHKILLKLGLFDYIICNQYDELSKQKILSIIDEKGDYNDFSR